MYTIYKYIVYGINKNDPTTYNNFEYWRNHPPSAAPSVQAEDDRAAGACSVDVEDLQRRRRRRRRQVARTQECGGKGRVSDQRMWSETLTDGKQTRETRIMSGGFGSSCSGNLFYILCVNVMPLYAAMTISFWILYRSDPYLFDAICVLYTVYCTYHAYQSKWLC